eukprot:scaffold102859_cov23-Tisochrysis_lutea.AAC.3
MDGRTLLFVALKVTKRILLSGQGGTLRLRAPSATLWCYGERCARPAKNIDAQLSTILDP